MKRGRPALPALLCAPLLLSGCVATQRDVLDLSGQMDDVKFRMTQLQGTLENLQTNQADLFVRMESVQTSITRLNENLGDFNHQLSTLKSRWDDLESRVDQRMKSVQETVERQQAEETAALPGRTFREAELNLLKKNYDLALQGFELYLKLAPQGELADQATYHSGEAHHGKKSYSDAAKAFATVLDRWPRSRLTAASRLRYALALLALPKDDKRTEEAERYLQSVLDDFPRTPEADAAREHLKGLREPPPAPEKAPAKSPDSPKTKPAEKARPADKPKPTRKSKPASP